VRAGLALTPLGEFSFIIAQMGVMTGAVPKTFYPMAVGASLLTSFCYPRSCGARPPSGRGWTSDCG
jgi:CPA2 family monovalent cation:H+ antiporter-2